jgi:hypothetical protein
LYAVTVKISFFARDPTGQYERSFKAVQKAAHYMKFWFSIRAGIFE